MTTIYLSERTGRNGGQYQVFGTYEGEDDRYVFGFQSFATLADAELVSAAMVARHKADHFARIQD